MIHLTDRWIVPCLALLADWSIRWGLVLAPLLGWFALRPPRQTAIRYLLCLSALAAGMLLPLSPRWGNAVIRWPSRGGQADEGATRPVLRSANLEGFGPKSTISPDANQPGLLRQSPASNLRTEPVGPNRSPHPFEPIAALVTWRLAALVTTVAWSAVVLALLSRLVFGRLMLARLRRGAVEVSWQSDGLLGECRARLGLTRHPRLAVHPAVASPLVVGGFRPVVLVPSDWGDWPEADRRAALLHELAHLARYDDWAKLVQEILRAPFFFHPLVRWLLNRLDRERELLCDEATVAQGSDPVAYARLLFDLARRPGRLLGVTPSARQGWLPFLDRRTVKVRIHRLLEKDMLGTISPLSNARSLVVVGLSLAFASAIGGLRVLASSAPSPGPQSQIEVAAELPRRTEARDAPAQTAAPVAKATPAEIRGVILDPDNHPVSAATIVVGACDPGQAGHQVITSDAEGRFTWALPADPKMVCLVARKDGFSASARLDYAPALVDPHDFKIRLGKAESFTATLVDVGGKPVAGANVRVEMVAESIEEKNARGSLISTGYMRFPREIVEGSPVEEFLATTTDAGGSFTFKAIASGAGLKLGVATADGRTMRVKSGATEVGLVREHLHAEGFVTAPPGETTRLVEVPAARIAGRVVSKLPGVGVAGLTASLQESHQPNVISPSGNSWMEVLTDSEGRFGFDGLFEGTVNVFVHGDGENRTWTFRAAKDVNLVPGETTEVTLELIRGIEIEGTVVAQGTGAPLEGAQAGVYGPFRPKTGAATIGAKTDARGRYHYYLPSGETYFYVMGPPSGFTTLANEGSSRTVTIPDGVSNYQVPPLELAPAVTIRGKVLDATGTPVAGAKIVGLCAGGLCRPFEGTDTITDTRGEFRLPPGRNNTVAVGESARLLIRLQGGVEHQADAIAAEDGAVVIKLPPVGAAPETP